MTSQQVLNQIYKLQQDNAALTERLNQVEKVLSTLKAKKKKQVKLTPSSE